MTTTTWITKDLPSWLDNKVDKKLEVHSNYTQQQDTTGVMLKYDGINDSSKEYYGPVNAANIPNGYQHKRTWTDSINNNPSAMILILFH